MMKKQHLTVLLLQTTVLCHAILQEEVGKDLPTNSNNNDILSRKRRPVAGGGGPGGGSGCNFSGVRRGKPKVDGTGRTFFDLQFLNVGYYHTYNINCGGGGGHPAGVGGQHPVQGGHGGGVQAQGGSLPNKKPILSMILANRPLQGLFSQSQSQSQTQTQSGVLGDAISGLASLLPKPADIGQGLGQGISSFIETIPQIGQSFQSLLPSFDNFQFPSLPSLPPLTEAGSQSMAIAGSRPPMRPATLSPSPPTGIVTPAAPDLVTEPTIDPDDIIFNDDVKPVHEAPDVVTGPHVTNKLPPGAYFNRYRAQTRYQTYKNYQNQKINAQANRNKYHYQQNRPWYGDREPRFRQDVDIYSESNGRSSNFQNERSGSRGFRFPT